ncbi:hypothetical protein Tco_1200442 [Tanacetum coccineum]
MKTERELVRIKIDDGNAFWNEIEVKSRNSKVSTARALLSTAGHYLFWHTATASTLDNGEMEITATIDEKVKIVIEASIKRHLKLEDSDGISNLPTTKIFKQLALMGIPALRLSPFCFILLFILSQSIIFQQYTTLGASVSTASASSAKDKGKAIIKEAENIQTKTKLQQEQERLGYEVALRLQEQLDEEERQRIAKVHEAASSFNIEEVGRLYIG